MTWASAALEDERQKNAVVQITAQWYNRNIDELEDWLEARPAGPVRDQSITALARRLDTKRPRSAAEWATTISDSALKTKVLTDICRTWLARDTDAATVWMRHNNWTL
jgi:hypothetical protein